MTPFGKRHALTSVLHPPSSRDRILSRQDAVEALLASDETRSALGRLFRGLPDLERNCVKFEAAAHSTETAPLPRRSQRDLACLVQTLAGFRRLLDGDFEGILAPLTSASKLLGGIHESWPLPGLVREIEELQAYFTDISGTAGLKPAGSKNATMTCSPPAGVDIELDSASEGVSTLQNELTVPSTPPHCNAL